ncbi:MAG: hypothetical protein JNM17_13215 [Archangium sp.]|nr:hypothetical protein [Archangium sp.]
MRWVLVLVLVAGCYTKRTIVVPEGEHGRLCLKDADLQWQLCLMQQRGKFFCDARRDDELLLCEGAFELPPGTTTLPDGGSATETPTYTLPGYQP